MVFICWGFSSNREFCSHMGTSQLQVKGCKCLTYIWHSQQFSSEGYLTCHTYYDAGHQYTRSSPKTRTLIPVAERSAVELSLPVLTTQVCQGRYSKTQCNNLTDCTAAVVLWSLTSSVNLYPRSIFIHVPCLTLDNTKNRYGSYLEGIEILNYTKT